MCYNNNDCSCVWLILIIILILFGCGGCNNGYNNCGCNNNCGCSNNCGCGNDSCSCCN